MNDANKALVVAAYQRGIAVHAICHAANIAPSSLYHILDGAGIPRRVPSDPAERIAVELLQAHEAKQWLCRSELMRRVPGATGAMIDRVRNELQEQGRVGTRADYAVCYLCGKPAVARAMCHTHYREARHRQAQRSAG